MASERDGLLSKAFGSKKELDKQSRSIAASTLGGSSSIGEFKVVDPDNAGASMTPSELGRKELYNQIPFHATMGLQKKEKDVSQGFADYTADLDVQAQGNNLSEDDKLARRSYTSLLILDELEFESKVVTVPLVFAVFIAALTQFSVGYNTGVMNAPVNVVYPGHSILSWSLAVSAFAMGGPLGAQLGGYLADTRGRRGALLIDMWTFLLGGIVQTFAPDMITIIVARFIIGFASGFSSVLVPVYLGEMAPPNLRGSLGTLTQFALVIGILVSDLLAFAFATDRLWRVLFAVTAITAVVQLALSPFLLESPRWLLNRDRASLKARYIIKQLRGLKTDAEVEREVQNFVMVSADEKEEKMSMRAILGEMFRRPKIRHLLIGSLVLQISQQLSGINAVFYYSTIFFQGVISNPLVGTTVLGAVNVVATYAALLLMDRCGRKTLILWSSGGMFVSCIIIILSLLKIFPRLVSLVAMNFYVVFFEIGLGPIPWLIVAEMFETKYVAAAMSISSQMNWAMNIVVGFVFPYMNIYLGPYSFGPFAGVLAVCFIYTVFQLPETQGTTPDQLAADLVARNSASVTYEPNAENTGDTLNQEWRKAMEQLMKEEEKQMETGKYDYGFKPPQKPENQVV